jgi:predicted amidohydrolase
VTSTRWPTRPWDLKPLTPRPASSTSPAVGELPFIRVHDASAFDVTVDFTLARPLEAIARSLDGFAALHPNERQDELDLPAAGHQVFPVAPKDAGTQRERLVRLVESALTSGMPISVLPELSLTARDVDALHALVAAWDEPHLLVAGSHHTTVDGHPENVAEGLVSGQERRMRHLKAMPFSDELRLKPPEKEGIRQRARPHVIVHQADCFRVGIAICKELLDRATTDPLDRMGVNLLLVPAFSEKTQAFRDACSARALRAQATTIVVNGPLRDSRGTMINPAIVVGQPVDGTTAAGFTVRVPTPTVTRIDFPADPMG